jgi:hypothetical protein
MSEAANPHDTALRIAYLRLRAQQARRLQQDVLDSRAKTGLIEIAEEFERQAGELEAQRAPSARAISTPSSQNSVSASRPA